MKSKGDGMRLPKSFSLRWSMAMMISLLRLPCSQPALTLSLTKHEFDSLLYYHLYIQVPTPQPSQKSTALKLQVNIRQELCVLAGMNSGLFLTQLSVPAS